MYLWLVKPFCARDVNRFTTDFNLLLTAREIILYIHPRREIGLHFRMSFAAPFLGMSLIIDPLKLFVSDFFRNVSVAYLARGFRNINQKRFIKLVLIPSKPGADLLFAPSKAIPSSSSVKGVSRLFFSSSLSLRFCTRGWAQISFPRKSLMQPSRLSGSVIGFLKEFAKCVLIKFF